MRSGASWVLSAWITVASATVPALPAGAASEAPSTVVPTTRIAVLPVHNLSGTAVRLESLEARLRDEVQRAGLRIVDAEALDGFLRRHRIRWTGGVGRRVGTLLQSEDLADAVLVTSLDGYTDAVPPKVALTSRIVTVGPEPRILWMDASHLSGDQSPGALSLGIVDDVDELTNRAVDRLFDSLCRQLDGQDPKHPPWKSLARFGPKRFSGSADALRNVGRSPRVAVLPFLNASTRSHAGDIVMLQVVRQLAGSRTIELLDPGTVREALLQVRIIQEDGLSLAQADAVRALLRVDVVATGRVADYREALGTFDSPRVAFSFRVLDTERRQVIWSSVSYNRGDNGVFFFDAGRMFTAHELAFEMSRSVVDRLTLWTSKIVKQAARREARQEPSVRREVDIAAMRAVPPARDPGPGGH